MEDDGRCGIENERWIMEDERYEAKDKDKRCK